MPRMSLWFALVALLSALVGGGVVLAAGTLMPTRVAGGDHVRDYLLEHPEVIPEAMQRLQERETGKQVAAHRATILTPFPGAEAGNPKGDVTVAVYMDYACGYCRASLPNIERLIATDKRVRIIYRELPILSADSRTAASWALAAARQGRFKRFHDALFAAGQVNAESIARAAAAAGLDRARAAADARDPAIAAEIERNLTTAGRLGMSGTPSWVIGNRILAGAQPYDALADAVRAARGG
jgi:protein-disulfide isomerase